ncbi:TetR/AcrR family transcriptional regulator [Ktedonosporobacter rubrisoli]|nr:TetR/AcrR family transcriptional regulator [Ktedonosporobacter rubrisoli]
MEKARRNADRRIERTRQLLRQASIEILQEKGFQATSVQEIAERANLNRGTFYAHFPDKYALLESLVRERFEQLVCSLPPVSSWERREVQQLICIILEDFRDVYRQCHSLGTISPLVTEIIQEELAGLLLSWLQELKKGARWGTVAKETVARAMSWAIIGEALQWSKEPGRASSDQVAHDLLALLLEGVEHLAPAARAE